MMCIRAIAMKIPPANAFPMPRILGLSLITLHLTGMIPIMSASKKEITQNEIWIAFAVSFIFV